MSLPDRDLDPEDVEVCEDHGQARPCKYCRFDHLMQMAELMREDTRESNP